MSRKQTRSPSPDTARSRNPKSASQAPLPVSDPIQAGAAKTSARLITSVQAKIDVGFGNALFIRGQGANLSWDKGRRMTCSDEATWVWSTDEASGEIIFKLLLNDKIWCKGEDIRLGAGHSVEIVPAF